jgi:hypothetical protein
MFLSIKRDAGSYYLRSWIPLVGSKQAVQLRVDLLDDVSEILFMLRELVFIHVHNEQRAFFVGLDPFVVIFIQTLEVV